MIVETTLKNYSNPDYGTDGGNDTTDKIFLLSMDEVEEYMVQNERKSVSGWWLRSPGGIQNAAAVVFLDGYIPAYGFNVSYELGVRPALNLKF